MNSLLKQHENEFKKTIHIGVYGKEVTQAISIICNLVSNEAKIEIVLICSRFERNITILNRFVTLIGSVTENNKLSKGSAIFMAIKSG